MASWGWLTPRRGRGVARTIRVEDLRDPPGNVPAVRGREPLVQPDVDHPVAVGVARSLLEALAGSELEVTPVVIARDGTWFYMGLLAALFLFIYQQFLIMDRKPEPCFRAFLNNHYVGMAIFVGLALDYLVRPA